MNHFAAVRLCLAPGGDESLFETALFDILHIKWRRLSILKLFLQMQVNANWRIVSDDLYVRAAHIGYRPMKVVPPKLQAYALSFVDGADRFSFGVADKRSESMCSLLII